MVKVTPPAYKVPDIQTDVEVEVTLCDMKTKGETTPVTFLYRGSGKLTCRRLEGKSSQVFFFLWDARRTVN